MPQNRRNFWHKFSIQSGSSYLSFGEMSADEIYNTYNFTCTVTK